MIIEMPKDVPLPATGTINYKSILVKANFTEDRWVVAADLRPGNAQAVHHMRAIVRPPGSDWMKDAVPGVAYEAGDVEIGRQGEGTDLLGKFNPGLGAQDFSMFDSAKFVPKGSDIVFSMHYTAIGKETTDRSKLGLVFAKQPPRLRYFTHDGPTAGNLAIPAGDSRAEVVSEMTATADTQLVYLQPHMHLRGKDYEVRLIYPSGKSETIFKAKWDFNWQLGFDLEKPIPIPKGTRIVGIAHFDNSAANKFNPDPTKLVVWGPQNWEEMQNCFMSFLIDPALKNPRTLFRPSGPSLLKRGESGPTLAALVLPDAQINATMEPSAVGDLRSATSERTQRENRSIAPRIPEIPRGQSVVRGVRLAGPRSSARPPARTLPRRPPRTSSSPIRLRPSTSWNSRRQPRRHCRRRTGDTSPQASTTMRR